MKPNVTKTVWAGKFQLVPFVLFVSTLIVFMGYATQYVASHLAYQRALGAPWVYLLGRPLYRPWEVIPWNYWYHYYAPRIFNHGMLICAGGALCAMVVAILYAVWIARRARVATSQGTARWATLRDIWRYGLLGGKGVVLGLTSDGRYLQHDTGQHVLSVAPTGSGKGVGQIIPTLLSWAGSVVVHDIKGENWEVTAGYRAQFSNVLYFNPCNLKSCHFNPLWEIRPGITQVRDAQNIVTMLIDPLGKRNLDFWEREATTLLAACLLHVLYCEEEKSLAGVAYFLADPNRTATDTIEMMRTHVYPDAATTRFINSSAQQAAQKYEKELSGVISSCLSVLGLYRDPVIEQITADSDFKVSDLIDANHPVSLYMIIPSSDDTRITPLVRLMWSQIGRRLMEKHPLPPPPRAPLKPLLRRWTAVLLGRRDRDDAKRPSDRHPILLMMDEFPTLGYMEIFHTAIAKIRSYGVKIFIITQSNNQIEDVYGPKHPFTSNCTVRTFYTPNDNPTADAISAALGTKTEVHQQKTYTGHRFAPILGHTMVADQEVARALLTPGEVLTFGNEEAIIFVTGGHPIRARKLRFYEDKNFLARLLPEPPLSEKRPYRYRPHPQPNPWATMVKPSGTPASASTSPIKPRGANEERGLDRDIADRKDSHEQPSPAVDRDPTQTSEAEFDAWHAATLASTGNATGNTASALEEVTDRNRRGELDRSEARRGQLAQRRHRERGRDLGR